jgi:hypothetical protein
LAWLDLAISGLIEVAELPNSAVSA